MNAPMGFGGQPPHFPAHHRVEDFDRFDPPPRRFWSAETINAAVLIGVVLVLAGGIVVGLGSLRSAGLL